MVDPLPTAFVLTFWTVAGLMGLVAVVTLWGGRRESWTVWLSSFAVLMAVAYASFGATTFQTLVAGAPAWLDHAPGIAEVTYLFGLASLVLFASVFPRRRGVFARPLAAAPLLVAGLALVGLEVFGGQVSQRAILSPVGLLYGGYVAGCYLVASVLVVRSFQDSESAAMARQARIVATGVLVVALPWVAEVATRVSFSLVDLASRSGALLVRTAVWPSVLALGYLFVVPSGAGSDGPPGFAREQGKLHRFVGITFAVFVGLWLLGHVAVVSQALGRPPSELMSSLTDTTILWTVQGRWAVLAVTLMGGVLRYGVLGIDPGAWRRGLVAVVGVASFALVGAAALTGGAWVAGASAAAIGTVAVAAARRPREADRAVTGLDRRARRLYRERLSRLLENGAPEDEVLEELGEAFDLEEREREMLAAVARAEAELASEDAAAVDGRYAIRERLGAGAFGVAYRVEDREAGRTLVLKRLHRAQGSSLPELEVARQVSHPNVASIHDVMELDTGPAILMEHLAGGSVRDRIEAGSVAPERAAAILDDTLAGLAALHDRGIAHGDLKPSNLLLDDAGTVKLADFGLASSEDRQVGTTLVAGAGTPDYLPPERRDRETPTPGDDLYAVGVVALELVTGRGDPGAVDELPDAWRRFVRRALRVGDAEPFASAAEMRAQLPQGGDAR